MSKTKILSGLWEIRKKPNVATGVDPPMIIKIQNLKINSNPIIVYIDDNLNYAGWDYLSIAKKRYKLICRTNYLLEQEAIKNIKDKLDSIE